MNATTNPNLSDVRTVEVGFLDSHNTGHTMLHVSEGVPVYEVMDAAGHLLDGLGCLLRSLSGPDREGEANGMELHALTVLARTASCMVTACSRAMEQEEAGHERS